MTPFDVALATVTALPLEVTVAFQALTTA